MEKYEAKDVGLLVDIFPAVSWLVKACPLFQLDGGLDLRAIECRKSVFSRLALMRPIRVFNNWGKKSGSAFLCLFQSCPFIW